jgi:hypothetical protein
MELLQIQHTPTAFNARMLFCQVGVADCCVSTESAIYGHITDSNLTELPFCRIRCDTYEFCLLLEPPPAWPFDCCVFLLMWGDGDSASHPNASEKSRVVAAVLRGGERAASLWFWAPLWSGSSSSSSASLCVMAHRRRASLISSLVGMVLVSQWIEFSGIDVLMFEIIWVLWLCAEGISRWHLRVIEKGNTKKI